MILKQLLIKYCWMTMQHIEDLVDVNKVLALLESQIEESNYRLLGTLHNGELMKLLDGLLKHLDNNEFTSFLWVSRRMLKSLRLQLSN